MSEYIVTNCYITDFPSEGLCKFLPYLSSVTTSWSALLLLMISVCQSRYLKVCRPTGKQWRDFGGSAPFSFAFRLQKSSQVHFYILLAKKYMYVSCLNTNMTVVMRDLQNFNETVNYLKTQYWYIAFSIISLNVVITAILWIPIGVQIF